MLILFALEKTGGQLLTNLPYNFKERKSMTSSLKQVKTFSDLKMIIVSAMKNSCGQLFLFGFSDWKERKVHNQFTRAGKNSCGQLFVI